ncbi:MAG: hypothetical protein ACI9KE_005960 [Polyangiales bacterium]|jgi:hypothetical protein
MEWLRVRQASSKTGRCSNLPFHCSVVIKLHRLEATNEGHEDMYFTAEKKWVSSRLILTPTTRVAWSR